MERIEKSERQSPTKDDFPIRFNATVFLVTWASGVIARPVMDVLVQYIYAIGSFTAGIVIMLYYILYPFWKNNITVAGVLIKKKKKISLKRLAGITLIVPASIFGYWVSCVILFRYPFRWDIYMLAGVGFLLVYLTVLLFEVIFKERFETYDTYRFGTKSERRRVVKGLSVFILGLIFHLAYIYFVVIKITGGTG
jgi:hypothetical protein